MKKPIRWILAVTAAVLVCAILGVLVWSWYDSHVDRSGWEEENGLRCYKDFHGKPVTGWLELDTGRYYLDEAGAMATSWQEIDGKRYYFGGDGVMARGWLELDTGRYYLDETGVMTTGWLELDGSRYFMGQTGAAAVGWQEIDGKRCYFQEDGSLACGWMELDDGRYYLDETGTAAVGWQEIDGKRYYFGSDGAMVTGWLELDGSRYYLGDDGMLTGWNEIGGLRYYFHPDGTAYTGWLQEGEYSYYLREDGSAAVGPTEIEGQTYYFSPKGIHIWLVNPWNYLHEDYEVELVTAEAGYRVADICKDALLQMLADCRAAGNSPVLCSGYRSYWDQMALYEEKIAEYGVAYGKQIVAVPNTSEHQLGLAVDIVDSSNRKLNASQANNAVQQWLMEHCWEYGFILRYPTDSSDITGIIFEPWHYRYVGVEVALELRELGITLEEYLGADNHT